jgi:hypothetical protein
MAVPIMELPEEFPFLNQLFTLNLVVPMAQANTDYKRRTVYNCFLSDEHRIFLPRATCN